MCDKLPYSNPRIDKCLIKEIEEINEIGLYRTILSCCGHNKYAKTIVVKERSTGRILEYFTKIELKPKKRNRYYKRDPEGYYYIPEIPFITMSEAIKNLREHTEKMREQRRKRNEEEYRELEKRIEE